MRAVILAAGAVHDYERLHPLVGKPDLVICADGGIAHAAPLGLSPSLILGDFDSADAGLLTKLASRGTPVQRVPVEKDSTDTHLALNEAVSRGATEVLLVGGAGSRLDHTLANILLLPGYATPVTMADGKNIARLLRSGERLVLQGREGEYISLLPLTPTVTGVVAEGVKWPLASATLRWGESLGVSNQFAGPTARVRIDEGALLVVQAWD